MWDPLTDSLAAALSKGSLIYCTHTKNDVREGATRRRDLGCWLVLAVDTRGSQWAALSSAPSGGGIRRVARVVLEVTRAHGTSASERPSQTCKGGAVQVDNLDDISLKSFGFNWLKVHPFEAYGFKC